MPEVITKFVEQARSWVHGVLAAAIKDQAGARIRQPQIDEYDFAKSIDPTHTMIAKDANDHPLHDLAGSLARKAVWAVGRSVADAWEGQGSTDQAIACASKYFAHPSHTQEFEDDVADWASKHADAIAAASDQRGHSSEPRSIARARMTIRHGPLGCKPHGRSGLDTTQH